MFIQNSETFDAKKINFDSKKDLNSLLNNVLSKEILNEFINIIVDFTCGDFELKIMSQSTNDIINGLNGFTEHMTIFDSYKKRFFTEEMLTMRVITLASNESQKVALAALNCLTTSLTDVTFKQTTFLLDINHCDILYHIYKLIEHPNESILNQALNIIQTLLTKYKLQMINDKQSEYSIVYKYIMRLEELGGLELLDQGQARPGMSPDTEKSLSFLVNKSE